MPSWISALVQKFKRSSKRESQIRHTGTRWVDTDSVWSPTSSLFLRSPDSTRSSHGIIPAIFRRRRRRNAFSGQTLSNPAGSQTELIATRTSERFKTGQTDSWSNAVSFEDEEISSVRFPRSLSSQDENKAWHCLQSAFESGSDTWFDSPLSRITKGLADSAPIPTPAYSYPRFASTPVSASSIPSAPTVSSIEVEEDPKAPRYAQRIALPVPSSNQRIVYLLGPHKRRSGPKLPVKFAVRMPFADDVDGEVLSRPSLTHRARSSTEVSRRPVSDLSHKILPALTDDTLLGEGTARRRASEGCQRPCCGIALQDLKGNTSWYSASNLPPSPRCLDFRSRFLFRKARASRQGETAYKGVGHLNAIWAPALREEGLRRRRLRRGRTRV